MVRESLELVFIEFRIPLPFDRPDPPFELDILQRVGATMLGGMVAAAMRLAPENGERAHSSERVASALREGARDGLRRALELEEKRQARRGELLARLAEEARRG
jgi:hypothetical protein